MNVLMIDSQNYNPRASKPDKDQVDRANTLYYTILV